MRDSGQRWRRTRTEAEFRDAVCDRQLAAPDLRFTICSDGTLWGESCGAAFRGTWCWSHGFFCPTVETGGVLLPRREEVVEVSESAIRWRDERGAGPAETAYFLR